MEFWVTIAGLVRRKRVIIPALLVATALGAAAYVSTPVTYVSSTTMILTSTEYGGTQSQDPAMPTDLVNPMLYFNDSLKTTSAILIEAMNSRRVATELGATGRTMVHVDDGRTNPNLLGLNGPFLYIVGESTSPTEAERVVPEAQQVMRAKLRDWQSALKAPERTFVSLVDVVPPSTPAPSRSRAMKLGLMAFVFGFGLCLGIAYLHHRTRDRRRTRAVTPPVAAAPPAPTTTEPALVAMTLAKEIEPDPVPTAPKKNGTAPVPTSAKKKPGPAPVPAAAKKKAESASVPTSAKKKAEPVPAPISREKAEPVAVAKAADRNGTAPVPTSPKRTEPALIRRSMKRKAELAVVPPTRPGRPAVRRPTSSPHQAEPVKSQNAGPTLVPVPVKRNGRSRNP